MALNTTPAPMGHLPPVESVSSVPTVQKAELGPRACGLPWQSPRDAHTSSQGQRPARPCQEETLVDLLTWEGQRPDSGATGGAGSLGFGCTHEKGPISRRSGAEHGRRAHRGGTGNTRAVVRGGGGGQLWAGLYLILLGALRQLPELGVQLRETPCDLLDASVQVPVLAILRVKVVFVALALLRGGNGGVFSEEM